MTDFFRDSSLIPKKKKKSDLIVDKHQRLGTNQGLNLVVLFHKLFFPRGSVIIREKKIAACCQKCCLR